MMLVDIITIALIVFFTLLGFKAGLIKTFGGFLGSVVGFIAGAAITYWLINNIDFFNHDVVAVITFVILSGLMMKVVEFFFDLLDRAYRFLTIIPFLKSINKLLGGVFGFFEALVSLGALAVFLLELFPQSTISIAIEHSAILSAIARPISNLVETVLS